MDAILAKASNQAVTFAIRSGISLASGFAIKTVTKFLDKIPENEKRKIVNGRNKIQTKINILSVSIDLVKLAAARGNTSLESVVELINGLNEEIDLFDAKINQIIRDINNINEKESIQRVEKMMRGLIDEINDAIPLINLALITCGVSLNGSLADQVSPGRLLQASDHVVKSNEAFESSDHAKNVQVGPAFDLVFYTIFYNPSRLKYIKESDFDSSSTTGPPGSASSASSSANDDLLSISWKEEFARSSATVVRVVDSKNKYSYKFRITEDFNDGRYHDDDSKPAVREYNLSSIKRLFFSASAKLLRLESRSSPVLIFKVVDEVCAKEEWIAFGEVEANEFSDDDDDDDDDDADSDDDDNNNEQKIIKNTSLSLLEYIVRLSTLQEHDSASVLTINDERLALYLRDESQSISVTNQSVIPPSRKLQAAEKLKHDKTEDLLTMNSNINRLEELKLHK